MSTLPFEVRECCRAHRRF